MPKTYLNPRVQDRTAVPRVGGSTSAHEWGAFRSPFAGAKVKSRGCEHVETVTMGEMASAKIKE